MKLYDVCEVDKLANGGIRKLDADGLKIVVARENDKFFALKDECSHEEFPLSEGWVEDGCLFCAFHGAKFDLQNGDALSLPAYEGVQTFPVHVQDGMVKVEVK